MGAEVQAAAARRGRGRPLGKAAGKVGFCSARRHERRLCGAIRACGEAQLTPQLPVRRSSRGVALAASSGNKLTGCGDEARRIGGARDLGVRPLPRQPHRPCRRWPPAGDQRPRGSTTTPAAWSRTRCRHRGRNRRCARRRSRRARSRSRLVAPARSTSTPTLAARCTRASRRRPRRPTRRSRRPPGRSSPTTARSRPPTTSRPPAARPRRPSSASAAARSRT